MKFLSFFWLGMFLTAVSWISATDGADNHGYSGENITITCSHSWASTNLKYFCRDPCKDTDVLVKSDQSSTGRYTLKDYGDGNFAVSITDLQESDSGIYWCGVERVGQDTFKKVKLIVSKGFVKESGPAGKTTGAEHSQSSPIAHIFPVPLYYIPYAAGGLAIIVIIMCAAGLVTVCLCRKRVKKSRHVINRSIYNSHHSAENAPDDTPYATIKKSSTKSNDESQSEAIYQNLQFNTIQEDAIYGNL